MFCCGEHSKRTVIRETFLTTIRIGIRTFRRTIPNVYPDTCFIAVLRLTRETTQSVMTIWPISSRSV